MPPPESAREAGARDGAPARTATIRGSRRRSRSTRRGEVRGRLARSRCRGGRGRALPNFGRVLGGVLGEVATAGPGPSVGGWSASRTARGGRRRGGRSWWSQTGDWGGGTSVDALQIWAYDGAAAGGGLLELSGSSSWNLQPLARHRPGSRPTALPGRCWHRPRIPTTRASTTSSRSRRCRRSGRSSGPRWPDSCRWRTGGPNWCRPRWRTPTAAASASASRAFDATGTHFDTVDIDDPLPKSTTTAT